MLPRTRQSRGDIAVRPQRSPRRHRSRVGPERRIAQAVADTRRQGNRAGEPPGRRRARDPDGAAAELPDICSRCSGGSARPDRRARRRTVGRSQVRRRGACRRPAPPAIDRGRGLHPDGDPLVADRPCHGGLAGRHSPDRGVDVARNPRTGAQRADGRRGRQGRVRAGLRLRAIARQPRGGHRADPGARAGRPRRDPRRDPAVDHSGPGGSRGDRLCDPAPRATADRPNHRPHQVHRSTPAARAASPRLRRHRRVRAREHGRHAAHPPGHATVRARLRRGQGRPARDRALHPLQHRAAP